jgi:hypothetical protein
MLPHIIKLETFELEGKLKRDHSKLHSDDLNKRVGEFDYTTLFYDIVVKQNSILIYCPKLFNLEAMIQNSFFSIDQKAVKFRIKRFSRHDVIDIKGSGSILEISNEVFNKSWQLNKFDCSRFKNMNCLVTINKNNQLEWISDFVKFYIQHHKLDCIVLFDNGSSDYNIQDLETCLQKTKIKDFAIVSIPQPFGMILENKDDSFLFLQPALLNLAKKKFFLEANAVLSIDIDELIWKKDKTVFEIATSSFFGFILFKGEWRFTAANLDSPRHKDHVFISKDQTGCPTKYCYTPRGIAHWFTLGIHRLHPRRTHLRNVINFFFKSKEVGYWHCRAITTNWKYQRNTKQEQSDKDKKFLEYFNSID